MTKEQFLYQLQQRLAFLPSSETARFLSYYREMIDDRMEEGMSETEAVADLGPIDRIVADIQYDMPVTSLVVSSMKERTKEAQAKAESRWPAWGKALAVLGIIFTAPIWLTLLLVLGSVVLAFLLGKFAIVLVVASLVLALALVSLGALVAGAAALFVEPALGLALLGLGLVGCGLSVFAYLLAVIVIKGLFHLAKLLLRWVKGLFVKKEAKTA